MSPESRRKVAPAERGSPRGMVSAPQCEAAHEGARVLREGGNAADALVPAVLIQGVADPHRSGLGGFGCATIFWNGAAGAPSRSLSVSFHGRAGSRARADQWKDLFEHPAPDGFGYIIKGKGNDVGHQAITTPGTLAGLAAIHRRFGTLPWGDLVRRAAPYAEEGFLVGPGLAEFWIRPGLYGRVSTRERIGHSEYGRSLNLKPDGSTYKAGEIFTNTDLARTYRRLADEGAESFYRGALAAEIAADWERGGALVTAEDLRRYRPVEEPPLEGSYRGFRILTSPLPGGGPSLLQALRLIEELPIGGLHRGESLGHNEPAYIDRLSRILKVVWADRLEKHGDPEFPGPRVEELLGEAHLARLRAAAEAPFALPPRAAESGGTTHLSIVDGEGNAICFSHSLGYGSGVFTPGLGFMFNNCMSGFDPIPGRVNSIEAGKARSTAVAETIILRGDRPYLILGAPGGARITAGLVQVIVSAIDFGMTAPEAILAPRFDGYGERTLFLESRFPLPVAAEMRRRGWEVTQSPKPFGMVGRVYAVEITPQGRLIGGVDPGEPGAAIRG